MEIIHNRFGKLTIQEITQGVLSNYFIELQNKGELPLQAYHGEAVKTAIKLKIIEIDPKIDVGDVDNSNPGAIRWYSEQLAKAIAEATSIRPE